MKHALPAEVLDLSTQMDLAKTHLAKQKDVITDEVRRTFEDLHLTPLPAIHGEHVLSFDKDKAALQMSVGTLIWLMPHGRLGHRASLVYLHKASPKSVVVYNLGVTTYAFTTLLLTKDDPEAFMISQASRTMISKWAGWAPTGVVLHDLVEDMTTRLAGDIGVYDDLSSTINDLRTRKDTLVNQSMDAMSQARDLLATTLGIPAAAVGKNRTQIVVSEWPYGKYLLHLLRAHASPEVRDAVNLLWPIEMPPEGTVAFRRQVNRG